MIDIHSFEQQLAALIGKPTEHRPCVCDGSPLECRAFIVGFNPASASDEDFWGFWDTAYGFDKAKWFKTYLRERNERPLKLGKSRRNPISNTRRVIDWIVAEALPVKILETNIYSVPSEEAKDLASHDRLTAPFDFLLSVIKPVVVLAHGNDAVSHLSQRAGSVKVMPLPHLSRGWSEVRARELGRQIARDCGNA